jgi:hypothetical protein
MNITYMPKRFENDPEFLRHWKHYATSSITTHQYTCSCGAKLKSVLQYANQQNEPTKTLYSQLAYRLAQHLKTNRHNQSIERILQFNEYLRKRFKKNYFNQLWNEFLNEEFGEADNSSTE